MSLATSRPFAGLTPGSYDLIMADPPWSFKVRSDKGLGKSADRHYSVMELSDIFALPVGDLAAKNCLLWLWTTAPMLHLQLPLLEAWGFVYKTNGVWVKTTSQDKISYGAGYYLRNAHETFLLATRGSCERITDVRSVIMARRREHSRKPDEAYWLAERMRPKVQVPKRLDLFSREDRAGWDSWGYEAKKFDRAPDSEWSAGAACV